MITADHSGPCAPIHLILPLGGVVVGFLSLVAILVTSRGGLI